jgi:peptidoglycan/xylan/chitin deacetylase (PgdA/CDA1 family)
MSVTVNQPTLTVAICVSRTTSALAASLDRLGALGPRLVIISAGMTPAEASKLRRLAGASTPAARLLWLTEPVLALARNAALAACTTELLAMIEDDVEVAPGWLAAVEQHWSSCSADVACVGGPLRLRFEGERPDWLSDRLTWGFPALDRGPAAMRMDLATDSFFGGNVSFRCEALRGVGGFLPLRGHPTARDWYSEEHHAQHELARAGWWGSFEPRMAATRCVDSEELGRRVLLWRRVRFGAREALHGSGPDRLQASRLIGRTIAGSLLSLARTGQPRRLMDRADSLALALGSLAPAVATHDFRPVAPSPFLAHLPPPTRDRARHPRRSSWRSPRSLVLLYHRVERRVDGSGLSVSPRHFEEHLAVLTAHARPLPLSELVEGVRRGRVPPGGVCVTFDDGYADNLDQALPRLHAAGVPASLFAATGPIAHGNAFFWDELDDLLIGLAGEAPARLSVTLDGDRRTWLTSTAPQRQVAREHLHRWIQPRAPETIEEALAQVRAWRRSVARRAGSEDPEAVTSMPRPMSVAELRRFSDSEGTEVGNHTRWHSNLRFQDPTRQREEIDAGRDDLADWLDQPRGGFAYPFGTPGTDFDAGTRDLVIRSGYRYAVANQLRAVDRHSDPYALPRLPVPDVDGEHFARWMKRMASYA